jgi:hypothetical protein
MRVGLYRPVHVKTLRSQKLRMLLTHRKLLQSKAIAVDNDLRAPRLENTTQFLRVTLCPTARNPGVVVDEDKRAVIDRGVLEGRFDQGKGLAILITRRVGQFVVGTGELPVEEPEKGAPTGFFVHDKSGWEERRDRGRIGPIFDGNAIAGVVPRWQRRQGRFSSGGERNCKSLEYFDMSLLSRTFGARSAICAPTSLWPWWPGVGFCYLAPP